MQLYFLCFCPHDPWAENPKENWDGSQENFTAFLRSAAEQDWKSRDPWAGQAPALSTSMGLGPVCPTLPAWRCSLTPWNWLKTLLFVASGLLGFLGDYHRSLVNQKVSGNATEVTFQKGSQKRRPPTALLNSAACPPRVQGNNNNKVANIFLF